MKFLSVCSGIEAASVAWEPLGWKALGFSEIEPFARAVLQHHWPEVPLHGDFATLDPPDDVDVLVGGTPCQGFSVAGLRGSLSDDRSNLALAFIRLANTIDERNHAQGKEPCIVVWENVPGVFSTKDNAFGCFLAGLAGEHVPLVPPGGRWTNAGAVHGPQRTIAWRVLDAQYFGVAQRRRRVFVVASAREGFDPVEVLFESDGVRRDTPPRREKGPSTAHDVAPSLVRSGRGVDRPGATRGQDPVVCVTGDVTHTLKAEGFDASEDGTGRGQPIVASFKWPQEVADPLTANEAKTYTQEGSHNFRTRNVVPHETEPFVFDTTQITHPENRCRPEPGDPCHPLAAAGHAPALASRAGVRRLMPVECEALQGFPRGHTDVPYRGRPAPADGPRYKALGNSMAVPVMRWIGERITRHPS